jgi:hypothetical protein
MSRDATRWEHRALPFILVAVQVLTRTGVLPALGNADDCYAEGAESMLSA